MRREYEDDDGRTIADMSDLPDVSIVGRWSGIHKDNAENGGLFGAGRSDAAEPVAMALAAMEALVVMVAVAASTKFQPPKWTAASVVCMSWVC